MLTLLPIIIVVCVSLPNLSPVGMRVDRVSSLLVSRVGVSLLLGISSVGLGHILLGNPFIMSLLQSVVFLTSPLLRSTSFAVTSCPVVLVLLLLLVGKRREIKTIPKLGNSSKI